MHWIAVKVQTFVEQPLTHARLAVLRRKRAPAFVRGACVKGSGQEAHQIGDGLRLQDHRVHARLDRPRLPRLYGLPYCFLSDLPDVESREVEVIAGVETRARAVGGARGHPKAALARPEVAAIP